ncbi:MAG: Uma2 family endonuclease [Planctomycetales bacterium]
MATIPAAPVGPIFETGTRMAREEFHRLYELEPEEIKAELVGGTVYVASPLRRRHGIVHLNLGAVFAAYMGGTQGVEAGDNATVLLGPDAEPQPDLYLRILPESGGRSGTTDGDYVDGPPEFLAEISVSTQDLDLQSKQDLDLQSKLEDFIKYGVLEYLVVCPVERELHWFDLSQRQPLHPDADGIYRIRTFPGMWIDGAALLDGDYPRLMAALQAGLASAEHAEFVRRLAAQLDRRQPQ